MQNSIQNPFPGIDPFVEAAGDWPDFHSRFMNDWCDAITAQLPDAYVARLEERLSVVRTEEIHPRRPAADIAISKIRPGRPQSVIASAVATLEPEFNRITIEEENRQTWIKIFRHHDLKLVTVVELLSPSNTHGEGRVQYLAKRHEVMMSEANLVELDLLIAGERPPLDQPAQAAHFRAVLSRAGQRPACEVYSWSLKQTMPLLPVPLLAPDADLQIDLAQVLATTYQRGRYWKTLKYDTPLELPLSDEYQAWVREQVSNPPVAESND